MNNSEFLLHDPNVEAKVLGSLVWSCKEGNFDVFFESRLTRDLFYYEQSATIFEIIGSLISDSVIPDEITIMDRITKAGITGIDPADVITWTEWQPGQEVNFFRINHF